MKNPDQDAFTDAIGEAIAAARRTESDIGLAVIKALRVASAASHAPNLRRPENDPYWERLAAFVNKEVAGFDQPSQSEGGLADFIRVRLVAYGLFDRPP